MIAKALSKNARVIVLDEPTAMLNEQEVHTLFQIIGSLRERGITVVYISHRMEEIYRIGDRVTVLKDGSYVGTWALSEINTQQLIVKMVGRELHDVYPSKQRPVGKELLRVENLTTEKIKGVSFSLREGEVVGLAGLVGSGRTEVLRAIFAADKLRSGQVILEGKQLSMGCPDRCDPERHRTAAGGTQAPGNRELSVCKGQHHADLFPADREIRLSEKGGRRCDRPTLYRHAAYQNAVCDAGGGESLRRQSAKGRCLKVAVYLPSDPASG